MDKYAQLEIFHYDCQLQVYIYAFMYVYPETMPVGEYFTDIKKFVKTKIKYILDWIELHMLIRIWVRSDKVKCFCENIVFLEEEWFADMNLSGGATFMTALTKHSKYIWNEKYNFHVIQSNACGKLQ